jgi:hypothetical protein
MRVTVSVVAGLALLVAGVRSAEASTIVLSTFTGTGSSGNLNPSTAPASEPWLINCSGGTKDDNGELCPTGDFGWGSPGIAQGLTPYTGTTPATDFEITFGSADRGFNLDQNQFALIPNPGCSGDALGGTVFCTSQAHPWTIVFDSNHPNSIAFFAPAGESLAPGQNYFANIFLQGTLPSSITFNGEWTAETAPEPASLLLLGTGLAAIAARRRKQRRTEA